MIRSAEKKPSLRCRIVVGIVAIAFGSLAVADESPGRGADRSSIRAVVEGLIAADNVEDIDRVLSSYSDDAVLITPTGEDVVGINAIRSHYEQLFEDADFRIQLTIDEITVSGNLAVVRGVNDVVATADSGASHVRSKFLMSLRRQSKGSWQVLHLIWSNQPASDEEGQL